MFKLKFLINFTLTATISFFSLFSNLNAKVLSSIKPIGFIANAISDGVTESEILLPDGASPHNYYAKPSDLIKLKSADLIIWVGDELESFLPSLLKSINKNKQLVLTDVNEIQKLLRAGHDHHEDESHCHEEEHTHTPSHTKEHNHEHEPALCANDEHEHDHHHGEMDMHIWLSTDIARKIAESIYEKLVSIYPKQKNKLNNNLEIFLKNLADTKQIIAKDLNKVQNNGYFVFHDAYGYFESEFNLKNLGNFTINPSVQPGFKKINEIQAEINNKKAVCVFKEPQFSPAVINKVVKGTKVKVGELDPLGINITLSTKAYTQFLLALTQQYLKCLN